MIKLCADCDSAPTHIVYSSVMPEGYYFLCDEHMETDYTSGDVYPLCIHCGYAVDSKDAKQLLCDTCLFGDDFDVL